MRRKSSVDKGCTDDWTTHSLRSRPHYGDYLLRIAEGLA
jgi:hypothetical protein